MLTVTKDAYYANQVSLFLRIKFPDYKLLNHLEFEPGHPDDDGVPRDAEYDGQRVEHDAHVVHNGVDVDRRHLVVL